MSRNVNKTGQRSAGNADSRAFHQKAFHQKLVWLLAIVLLILHHDFWWWDSRVLVLGFLPIGLAYHIAYSLAAGALWVYAIFFAWPRDLEQWADEAELGQASQTATAAGSSDGGEAR